jgi:hypothetical protein
MFTLDSWGHKHIKSHNPEHHQVAPQNDLTNHSTHRPIKPPQHCEVNANNDFIDQQGAIPYLAQLEIIIDFRSERPPPLPVT